MLDESDVGLGFFSQDFNILLDEGDVGLGFFSQDFNILLDESDVGLGFFSQDFNIPPDESDVGLGGQVAVEQVDLLVRQHLGLFLSEPVIRQVFDKTMGVKGNGFTHGRHSMSSPQRMQHNRLQVSCV